MARIRGVRSFVRGCVRVRVTGRPSGRLLLRAGGVARGVGRPLLGFALRAGGFVPGTRRRGPGLLRAGVG